MAYGARLESELGESPQGFKSPILRHKKRAPFWVFFSYSRGIRIWEPIARSETISCSRNGDMFPLSSAVTSMSVRVTDYSLTYVLGSLPKVPTWSVF